MDQLSKYQRIKVAMLRQQGGTMTVEKSNPHKQGLFNLLQRMVESGEGVRVIKESPVLVTYQFFRAGPNNTP